MNNNHWNRAEDQETAFDANLKALASIPILSCRDFKLPFMLQTDANSFGPKSLQPARTQGTVHGHYGLHFVSCTKIGFPHRQAVGEDKFRASNSVTGSDAVSQTSV